MIFLDVFSEQKPFFFPRPFDFLQKIRLNENYNISLESKKITNLRVILLV